MNINKYNSSNSLLVVAPYPIHGTVHTGGGLASYTKNTLLGIKKSNPDQKIIVLANTIKDPETYIENGILVLRCWSRNSITLFPSILKQIVSFNAVKNILFEFEFAAYGNLPITSLIPVFLTILKIMGKKVVGVVHQVITDLATLTNHVGISESSLSKYNYLLKLYYRMFLGLCSHVVVLENDLKSRLDQLISDPDKVICLPHGVLTQKKINKVSAKKLLGLDQKTFYVLAFGYLGFYKGSDLLVKAFQKPLQYKNKQVKLILAGGESPTQGQKGHYQDYYAKLYREIDSNPNIIHTGFVPDTKIRKYFSGADIAIFPYRTFMSASGPVSLALSYGRNLLVSSVLGHYSDHTFNLNSKSIRRAIVNELTQAKSAKNHSSIAADRSFELQGNKYRALFAKLDLWPRTSPKFDTSPLFAK